MTGSVCEMKLKVAFAATWLGLLTWAGPAVAAAEVPPFPLSVGHQKSVRLDDDKVDEILAEASKVLKKCGIVLKRKGHVGQFAAPRVPSPIDSAADRDAIHHEDFDIKVVELPIGFCRVEQPHEGCAWDPLPGKNKPQYKSMIVMHLPDVKQVARIWAHEFGHKRGLTHRSGNRKALMACRVPVELAEPELNDHECKCLRDGPEDCGDEIETPQTCSIH